ncbi:MAG TPA: M20/M25/M40 family metallo-hydrolase [bacterium]|nr:M20/M25/M40 family metallo-hydrolase [bacterium]
MTSEHESMLSCCLDALEEESIDLCRRLIRINTVNPYAGEKHCGSEAAGQDVIEEVLRNLRPAATIERFDAPDDVYEQAGFIGPKGRNFRGRPIVTADWDFGSVNGKSPSIILNDHIDTVGVEGMTIDPFSAEIRDGRIWGRGATDTKGGIVTGLWAIRALLESGIPLHGRLSFECVIDEECNGSGAGTLACRLRGRTADEAIVMDGESNVIHGCDGVITVALKVKGVGGHSGQRGYRVNAIEKAFVVKVAIDAFAAERLRVCPVPVNLGVFRAGTVPAMVPAEAVMELNAVYSAEEGNRAFRDGFQHTGEPVFKRLVEHVRATERQDEWLREHPSEIEWVKDLPPFRVASDHPLVTDLARAYSDTVGRAPGVGIMSGWTDAAHFANQSGMPVVMFGTGVECAHAQEEWVEIETLRNNARTIALFLLRRLCKEAP